MTEKMQWEQPIPLVEYNLPPFPTDALPRRVRLYVEAVAEATQTPVDMAGTAALAIMASCVQGKYRIQVKADWTEPTNIYALIIADPAERKSAIVNLMTKPLRLYENDYNNKHAAEFEKNKMMKRVLEKKQRDIEEKVARGEAGEAELDAIGEEISSYKELAPMQLFYDDVTPEKLISVLTEHDGIASIISSEGGIFDLLAGGMYSLKVNIDVFLKGHAGDSIRIDRIGRNSECVNSPALTLLLAIQPNVLAGLMRNKTFRGRGLTARFLYTKPVTYVGSRRYQTAQIPKEVENQYYSLINNLLEEDCNPPTDDPVIITLSGEADIILGEFVNELEPKLRTDYMEYADWAGKLSGAIVRIAGILCRAASGGCYRSAESPGSLVVDGAIMQNAIRLGKYYAEHARAAYSLMGADPLIRQCQYVLEGIRNARQSELSKRDIMRLCRAIKKADELQPVLDRLCEYGYLAPISGEARSGIGRPASPQYLVNPAVFSP